MGIVPQSTLAKRQICITFFLPNKMLLQCHLVDCTILNCILLFLMIVSCCGIWHVVCHLTCGCILYCQRRFFIFIFILYVEVVLLIVLPYQRLNHSCYFVSLLLKAWVKGSTWIPIFDDNSGFDPGTLSRKMINFVMGGWWSGAPTLSYNKQFLSNIEEKFPKDLDLIVACQKGLRSLAACELLYNAGYRNLFWVQGGLEASEEEQDLSREGPQPLKFAGIGGVSEFLGWTDQQRAAAAKEGWAYRLVFSAHLELRTH
ncbi:rhodanese-like domain-containing protein 11, chloroplastic isoform X3 [Eucalyptus grandis]|uniref:rhodanese-like domain-containing protein 11, chloroplastic isoform X3 n=1 Tax=Eucalyptus grandis TaxID=71139 RepID=UPI00192EDBF7|nr:rhodanese-like domain-containing protein 11, chloroplastic isoform X3 [Eucalyptus grandis]